MSLRARAPRAICRGDAAHGDRHDGDRRHAARRTPAGGSVAQTGHEKPRQLEHRARAAREDGAAFVAGNANQLAVAQRPHGGEPPLSRQHRHFTDALAARGLRDHFLRPIGVLDDHLEAAVNDDVEAVGGVVLAEQDAAAGQVKPLGGLAQGLECRGVERLEQRD